MNTAMRDQQAARRVTHVKPGTRMFAVPGYGRRNPTVAACRAFKPRARKRGGTPAPRRMDNQHRAKLYHRHRYWTSDGASARWLTPRQYRQISRMESLDARDQAHYRAKL